MEDNELEKEQMENDNENNDVDNELKEKLEKQETLLRQIQEDKSKLEGMVEGLKSIIANSQNAQTQQPVWTEEQWREFEEKTGFTKDQLMIVDSLTRTQLQEISKAFEEKIKQAEEKAKSAEQKLYEMESKERTQKIIKEYFKNKPSFLRYEEEINNFLSDYPEEVKKDPERLKKVLEKAEAYIKGKVGDKFSKGDKMRFNTTSEEPEFEEVNFNGLKPHEKLTIMKAYDNVKREEEIIKKYKHDLKGDAGVMISSREEFEAAEKDLRGIIR